MSPQYKIYYFNAYGRAELSRFILSYAGVPFDDVRYTFEEWSVARTTGNFPSDQMPALEIDGVKYGQSMAIARFLARETGLAGATSFEQYKADAIVDSIFDLLNKMWERRFHAKTDEDKAKLWQDIVETTAPRVFSNLEKLIEGEFFLGSHVTWADLAFAQVCEHFDVDGLTSLMESKHPKLVQLRDRLRNEEKIAKYRATRPKPLYTS